MRRNPADFCREIAGNNVTRFVACEKGMAGNWWMGFAAIGVLVGLIGVGFLAFYCCSKKQEGNRADSTAASGLLSSSGSFARANSSNNVDEESDNTYTVGIAPPGGSVH